MRRTVQTKAKQADTEEDIQGLFNEKENLSLGNRPEDLSSDTRRIMSKFIPFYNNNSHLAPLLDVAREIHSAFQLPAKYQFLNIIHGGTKLKNMLTGSPFVSEAIGSDLPDYCTYVKGVNDAFRIYYYGQLPSSLLTNLLKIFSYFKSVNNIHVIIYPSQFKKYLPPSTGSVLGSYAINSGYADCSSNKIVIWRQEEVLKVLIHELLHFVVKYDGQFATYANGLFNYKGTDNPIEAVVESLTVFIHTILFLSDVPFNPNLMIRALLLEISWSEYQCCKILRHYGATRFEQILKKDGDVVIEQTTSVLSYFVIKYLLLCRLDEVWNKVWNKGEVSFSKILSESINTNKAKINFLLADWPWNNRGFMSRTLRFSLLEKSY